MNEQKRAEDTPEYDPRLLPRPSMRAVEAGRREPYHLTYIKRMKQIEEFDK